MKTLMAVPSGNLLVTAVQANENPTINTVENAKDFAVNNEALQFVVKEYNDLLDASQDGLEQGKINLDKTKNRL